MRAEKIDQQRERTGSELAIGIKKEMELAASRGDRPVHATREADILGGSDHGHRQ